MVAWERVLVTIFSLLVHNDATTTLPADQLLETTSDIQEIKSMINIMNSTLLDFTKMMGKMNGRITTLPVEKQFKRTIESDIQHITSTVTTLNSTLVDLSHIVSKTDKQFKVNVDILKKIKEELKGYEQDIYHPLKQQYDAFTLHNINTGGWGDDELWCYTDDDDVIKDNPVRWNTTGRAYKTLPPGLRLAKSTIPNAGTGVFTDVFIPVGTYLGPYDGAIGYDMDGEYVFNIVKDGKPIFNRDAGPVEMSNWTRFINCARDIFEINMEFLQCREHVYFRTIKDIKPGSELFFFYGWAYAEDRLNIQREDFCKGFNGTIHGSIDSDWIC